MSYIGTPPSNAFTSLLKQDFSTSATTGYTLDHAVNNANDIALFINFVRQEPTAGYAASGTSLVLTSATASSDDMYCVYLGQALQTVNPANASVGISQLSATGTKNSTTFLRGDNTFAEAGGGKVLQVKYGQYTTQKSTTSTSFIDVNSTTNVSLTCAATSSKVLILAHFNECYLTGYHGINLRITAGGSSIAKSQQCLTASNSEKFYNQDITYLHSPSSTSSIEYKLQFAAQSGTVGINRFANPATSITLMEIGA